MEGLEKKTRTRFTEGKQKSVKTDAETSGGLLTSLRKRLAFAAAATKREEAATPFIFFNLLPGALGPAWRLFKPP